MCGTPGKSFSQLALEGIFPPSFLLDKKESFIGNPSLVAEKKKNPETFLDKTYSLFMKFKPHTIYSIRNGILERWGLPSKQEMVTIQTCRSSVRSLGSQVVFHKTTQIWQVENSCSRSSLLVLQTSSNYKLFRVEMSSDYPNVSILGTEDSCSWLVPPRAK